MLNGFRREIEARVAAGASLEQLERTVLRSLAWLDEDRQAALWLYAWHLTASSSRIAAAAAARAA